MADAAQRFRPWLLLVEDDAPLAEAIRLNLENEFEPKFRRRSGHKKHKRRKTMN